MVLIVFMRELLTFRQKQGAVFIADVRIRQFERFESRDDEVGNCYTREPLEIADSALRQARRSRRVVAQSGPEPAVQPRTRPYVW